MTSVAVVVSERLARYGFGDGHPFGPDRLAKLLKDTAPHDTEQAANHIVATLQNWSHAQNDDLTLLLCDYATV